MPRGVIEAYRERLPVSALTPALTLGEGGTPLVRSRAIEQQAGVGRLFFKLEGCNPTGSFKDRGMVVAVAKALEVGHETVLCASTGNTSAAAAAYAAAAGLRSIVLVPQGDIALGKLSQAMAYGAHIVSVRGKFDRALAIARQIADTYPISLVNSVNPHRIEGQKTAAFEIVDELGDAPDYLCIPVGNAGNITAYWRGFVEYATDGPASRRPRMMGFEAEGAAPIVTGKPVAEPTTVASAIRIGDPASWTGAVAARDESNGAIETVSDGEIVEAFRLLARGEGLFCEPASAASVAGLLKLAASSDRFAGRDVVCVLTGTGLKDPEFAMDAARIEPEEANAEFEAVAGLLGLRAG